MQKSDSIMWRVREPLSDRELQELFSAVYRRENTVPFHTILEHCLTWVSARDGGRLVGFANVVWDGLYHAIIVDRAALTDDLHHRAALEVLEVLRREYPTVSKVHIECTEAEIPLLEPLGFERRTYGRILY
jgi:hypothetical protein